MDYPNDKPGAVRPDDGQVSPLSDGALLEATLIDLAIAAGKTDAAAETGAATETDAAAETGAATETGAAAETGAATDKGGKKKKGKKEKGKTETGKTKKKPSLWLYDVLIVVFAGVFLVSAFFLGRWLLDNFRTKNQAQAAMSAAGVSEESSIKQETGEVVLPPLNSGPAENDTLPYYDLDLSELKELNSDTVAWVRLAGTNVNYPVVQSPDNEKYLTMTFEGTYSKAGWIFADYRNNLTDLSANRNLILYGHGRRDYSMFGSLEFCRRGWWLNNADYHTLNLTTLSEQTVWRVFSVYTTAVDFNYIRTDFIDDTDYQLFLNELKARSIYDFGVDLTPDDRIITLSTCTTDADRLVLQAVLVRSDPR